jgi:hypothetical protein
LPGVSEADLAVEPLTSGTFWFAAVKLTSNEFRRNIADKLAFQPNSQSSANLAKLLQHGFTQRITVL